jgi:ABC-type antimicrobial peptide transport system permease subunit
VFVNYLKVLWRNFIRQKLYSLVNVFGLAVGIACCVLILLWVRHETGFNRFHTHTDSLYRVIKEDLSTDRVKRYWQTPPPLSEGLKRNFPDIIRASRYTVINPRLVKKGMDGFYEDKVALADPDFFTMFDFRFVKGSADHAFDNIDSIVVTRAVAHKYFPGEEALGKSLNFDGKLDFTISGVIEDVPKNSDLQFEFLIPFVAITKITGRNQLENWGYQAFQTYVQLDANTSRAGAEQNIAGFLQQNYPKFKSRLWLQPLADMHLHGLNETGPIVYIYLFIAVALFVLFIACLNFMNLSTARYSNRAKEVGIRKVLGASRRNLIRQFLGESFLLVCLAMVAAIVLAALLLPAFNHLTGKELSLLEQMNGGNILGLLGIVVFTGFLAGSYPALFLSSFKPVVLFKGSVRTGAKSTLTRKVFIVGQFAISIFLVIFTVVVYSQLDYMKGQQMGLDRSNVIYIPMRGQLNKQYEYIKRELSGHSDILGVSASESLLLGGAAMTTTVHDWEGKQPDQMVKMNFVAIGHDYFDVNRLKMAEGREFKREQVTDATGACIINEEAAVMLGMKEPLGKEISLWPEYKRRVVGVVKNFHFASLRQQIEPIMFAIAPEYFRFILIRVNPAQVASSLDLIRRVCATANPGAPLDYHFLEEQFDRQYRAEQRLGGTFQSATILGVLIACLGLFGLASFVAQQREKEIGIRKVLGASVPDILWLLKKEFLILVVAANALAWPAAYLAKQEWLRDFAYRTGAGIEIFLLAFIGSLVIALLTVTYQSTKAALANPATTLKSE